MKKGIDVAKMMDSGMKKIAQIHIRNGGGSADWMFHQCIRFLFDGYPHHSGPLFRQLIQLEGKSLRVRGLRMILKSEAVQPTPFGNLRPKPHIKVR